MNHLVYLQTQSSGLEKILSGTKTMVLKEIDRAQPKPYSIEAGDSLYFLRDKDETILRVKATVVQVTATEGSKNEGLAFILKEMQSKLQLTEEQFQYWSAKKLILLVEFSSACKIEGLQVAPQKFIRRSGWIDFEDFSING